MSSSCRKALSVGVYHGGPVNVLTHVSQCRAFRDWWARFSWSINSPRHKSKLVSFALCEGTLWAAGCAPALQTHCSCEHRTMGTASPPFYYLQIISKYLVIGLEAQQIHSMEIPWRHTEDPFILLPTLLSIFRTNWASYWKQSFPDSRILSKQWLPVTKEEHKSSATATSSHIKTIWTRSWNSQNSWFRQQQRSRDMSVHISPSQPPSPRGSQYDKNEFPQQWRTLNRLMRFFTSVRQVLL